MILLLQNYMHIDPLKIPQFFSIFTSFIRCAPKAELVNFADDNTLYVSNKDLTKLFEIPQKEFFEIVIEQSEKE